MLDEINEAVLNHILNECDGKYKIFEDKSSVKEYAESLGVRLKWEKVKYDDW